MSGDELVVLLASGFLTVWGWYAWYLPPIAVESLGARRAGRGLLLLVPVVSLVILFALLKAAAAEDVRDDAGYLALYTLMGAAWTGTAMKLLPFVGLSPADDVVERSNGAAAVAISGALIGCTLCYAGGNIGNGPGWWVVVFSAGLATATLAVLWLLFDRFAHVVDTLTIDRDPAAGLRVFGLLSAAGVVLGRGVAGDWVSVQATLRDFTVLAWPVLALFAAAVLLEHAARPTRERPTPSVTALGVLPAGLYLAAALAYVVSLGPL